MPITKLERQEHSDVTVQRAAALRLAERAGLLAALVACVSVAIPRAQEPSSDASRRRSLDQILDLYVRNGDVYYRALKSDRAKLDGYLAQIGNEPVDKRSKEEQLSFWLNAYNAIVLRTVIDHYPIAGRAAQYPAKSIRQIPGAFERTPHRVAGRSLTLDQIEKEVLPTFQDPRVYFALGRGAVGSGRLRSEAFVAARLEEQLADVASECVSRAQCVQVDHEAGKMSVSSIFSWHEKEFSDVYGSKAPAAVSNRSPIERAAVAFVFPKLLTAEREMVEKNAFQLAYVPFDWTLNDLTGRGGR
jgi:uncharacterized protein DUF547